MLYKVLLNKQILQNIRFVIIIIVGSDRFASRRRVARK